MRDISNVFGFKSFIVEELNENLLNYNIYATYDKNKSIGTWGDTGITLDTRLYILNKFEEKICLGSEPNIASGLGWIDESVGEFTLSDIKPKHSLEELQELYNKTDNKEAKEWLGKAIRVAESKGHKK